MADKPRRIRTISHSLIPRLFVLSFFACLGFGGFYQLSKVALRLSADFWSGFAGAKGLHALAELGASAGLYASMLFGILMLWALGMDIMRERQLRRYSARTRQETVEPGEVFCMTLRIPLDDDEPLSELILLRYAEVDDGHLASWRFEEVERCTVTELDDGEHPTLQVCCIVPVDSILVNSGFFWKTGRLVAGHRYVVGLRRGGRWVLWSIPPALHWLV